MFLLFQPTYITWVTINLVIKLFSSDTENVDLDKSSMLLIGGMWLDSWLTNPLLHNAACCNSISFST